MLKFLLIFALIFVVSTAPAKQTTDLELIANDFSILARITNAIALQSSMLRKSVLPRVIVSEFLTIPQAELSAMLNLSVDAASSAISKLNEEVRKVDTGKLTKGDDLERLVNDTVRLGNLLSDIEKFPFDEKFSIDDLRAEMERTFKNMSFFDKICPKVEVHFVYSVAQEFGSKINDKNPRIAAIDIKQIGHELEMFLECFEIVKEYHKKLQALPLLSVFNKYKTALNAAINLAEYGDNSTKVLPSLEQDLGLSRSVWSDKSLFVGLERVTSEIDKSTSAFLYHLGHPYRTDPLKTVSFVQPDELLMVEKDLQSAWFNKHFVRGSSEVKKLSTALKPFYKVSETIMKLVDVWRPLINRHEAQKANDKSFGKAAGQMSRVASRQQNQKVPYDQVVGNTMQIWNDCSRFRSDQNISEMVEKLERQNFDVLNLTRTFMEVVLYAKDVFDVKQNHRGALRIYPNVTLHCLKATLRVYKEVISDENRSDEQKLTSITREFRRCANEVAGVGGVRLHHVARKFLNLDTYMKNLTIFVGEYEAAKTATILTTTAPGAAPEKVVTFQDIFKESKVLDLLKCLRAKNFQPVETNKAVKFVQSVQDFPDEKTIAEMTEYLKDVKNIQPALKAVENEINSVSNRAKRAAPQPNASDQNPVLAMNDSRARAEDFGECTLALRNMVQVQKRKATFLNFEKFHPSVASKLDRAGLDEFKDAKVALRKLVGAADKVEGAAKKLKGETPMKMAEIFNQMVDIKGIVDLRTRMSDVYNEKKKSRIWKQTTQQFETLLEINLDFAHYRGRLLEGRSLVNGFKKYFDVIFNHAKKPEPVHSTSHSVVFLIGMCVGSVVLVLAIGFTIFAVTKKGREKLRNWYMYYFGKPEEFEKRWRYSCFMDKVNGENALLDSVRETNKANLLIALKRGVYVNAYNNFGNTALHAATKLGRPDMVEILIRNGADRSLLNIANRTPEQMIPAHFRTTHFDLVDKFERIQTIYRKYKNKSFRSRVPDVFPVSSFRIWPEDRTEDGVTNRFLAAFQHIASVETSNRTTHCVMKTDENGILETDSLSLLFWIFHGCIIVREQWMTDCLKNEKLIEQDYNYLVEKVRFKGEVYDTVLQWSNAMAKGELPYLFGVQVAVVMKEYANMVTLAAIVNAHGGTMLEEFPDKKKYHVGSHPYLHAHLGPLFIIHDGTSDLSAYAKDKMFTFFTEDTFIQFMLKREIYRDTSEEPICVFKDTE